MKDSFNRSIQYLRLSITERCDLKCKYCREAEGLCPKQAELSAAEFERIARTAASLGVNKIRLTGGEPLLRRDAVEIIERLNNIPGIGEISMTTNAQHLRDRAAELKSAGLSRLNISLDSLNAERYHKLTGGGDLHETLSAIEKSINAGLTPLKLNVVLMRGVNDCEIDDFIALAKNTPVDVRFIELMPLGETDYTSSRVYNSEILKERPWLKPLRKRYESQPSMDYAGEGFLGRVGFISPVSHKFCNTCNRIRVMSDGTLRPCLGDNLEVSLLPALKSGRDDELRKIIYEAIRNKPAGHNFLCGGFVSQKSMSRIGG